MAAAVSEFEDPSETPPAKPIETREERKARRKRESARQAQARAAKLEAASSEFDPANDASTALFEASRSGDTARVTQLLDEVDSVDVQGEYSNTALHLASANGHEEVVKLLLNKGAPLDVTDNTGNTALHLASANGHEEVVQWLLDKDASLDVKNKVGWTALHRASEYGHKEVVKLLLNKGAPLDVTDNTGNTALHLASANGHEEVVQWLLDKDASLDVKNKVGWTALHRASEHGHKEVMKLLLNKGAPLDVKDNTGNTALHWASEYGQKEVVQCLLDKGASLDVQTKSGGSTALHLAITAGHKQVVQLLLNKGAPLDVKDKTGNTALDVTDKSGRTALHAASADGCKEVVQLLLDKGAPLDVKGLSGYTALHLASAYGHKEVVQWLLDKGASLDVQTEAGNTALHLASEYGHKEVVQLLLDRGAMVGVQTHKGNTALHLASANGREEVVQLLNWVNKLLDACRRGDTATVTNLLGNGVSLHAKDSEGRTALHCASANGRKEVVQLLLDKGAPLDVQDNEGDTAQYLASYNEHKGVVAVFLKRRLLLGAPWLGEAFQKSYSTDVLLQALTEYDPDEFARIVALQQIRFNNASASGTGTGALQLVELAAGARIRAGKLRSDDPRAADNHRDLFERIQLATAACIQCHVDNDDAADDADDDAVNGKLCKVFSSPDGRKALERAVQIEAKELLAQPVVQRFVSLVWFRAPVIHEDKINKWVGRMILSILLLLELLFVLPVVVFVPSLDHRWGKDTEHNYWGRDQFYFLRLPVVKFVLETAADLALALTLTLVPAVDLATTPTAPFLLYWIGSALLWEARQIVTTASASESQLGRVRDNISAYMTEHLNRVDMLSLIFSFMSMVAVVSAGNPDDATATSLRAVGVFLLWCRLLRVPLISPKLGPFVLMFFRMLFGDVLSYLVLLLILLVAFAAAWTVLLQPSQSILAQQFGDDRQWQWTRSAVAHLEASNCFNELGGTDFPSTLQRLIEGALTGGDFFECARATTGVPLTAWFLSLVYVILTGVLLLNMLIAMMAKTFDNVSEAAATNYLFLFTQRTLALRKEPPTPGPLFALGLPCEAVVALIKLPQMLKERKERKAAEESKKREDAANMPAASELPSANNDSMEDAPAAAAAAQVQDQGEEVTRLAEQIRDYILDHQDDVAQEDRWRTTMKRDIAKSFRATETQLQDLTERLSETDHRLTERFGKADSQLEELAKLSRATDSQLQAILEELHGLGAKLGGDNQEQMASAPAAAPQGSSDGVPAKSDKREATQEQNAGAPAGASQGTKSALYC